MDNRLTLTGSILGERYLEKSEATKIGMVIHVNHVHAGGPAENAFVYVDLNDAEPRAKYISWINLFDIEYAGKRQKGTWRVKEEATLIEQEIHWFPFGWGGEPLPSVADRKS
jgi:hypothetical protein